MTWPTKWLVWSCRFERHMTFFWCLFLWFDYPPRVYSFLGVDFDCHNFNYHNQLSYLRFRLLRLMARMVWIGSILTITTTITTCFGIDGCWFQLQYLLLCLTLTLTLPTLLLTLVTFYIPQLITTWSRSILSFLHVLGLVQERHSIINHVPAISRTPFDVLAYLFINLLLGPSTDCRRR